MFTVLCRHAILIEKALKYFYMLQESHILCKHGNILLFLTLKENTISNIFTIYSYNTYCRNTYPKGRALMKMYGVVPQTKRGSRSLKQIAHHLCVQSVPNIINMFSSNLTKKREEITISNNDMINMFTEFYCGWRGFRLFVWRLGERSMTGLQKGSFVLQQPFVYNSVHLSSKQ